MNELQEEYAAVYGATYPDDPSFGDKAGEPIDYTPVLAVTYWGFRLMIGMGAVSAGGRGLRPVGHPARPGADVADRRVRRRCSRSRAPFVANAAGWIFTEMGRQPFVVVPNPDVPVERPGVVLHRAGGLPRRHAPPRSGSR